MKYLQVPLFAFFSRPLYRRAGQEWKGNGFLYLLALLTVTWLAVAVKLYAAISGLASNPEFRQFVDQIPRIEIEQGVVSVDVEQPYVIRDQNDPNFVFIIDTTGEITELDPDAEKGGLLTQDRLIMKRNQWETREFDLSQVESFWIDAARVKSWLPPLGLATAVLIAVLMPFVGLAYRIVLALILAGVGQALSRMFSVVLDWPALLRLAAVAMTPSIVLDTLAMILFPSPFSSCGWWLACGALNVGYMVFGLAANRTAPAPETFEAV